MEGALVLDPMAGSGTVLQAARGLDRDCIACDIDPLARLMMTVGVTPIDPAVARKSAQRILARAEEASSDRRLVNKMLRDVFDEESSRFIRFWFPPDSRRQLFTLWDEIRKEKIKGYVGSDSTLGVLGDRPRFLRRFVHLGSVWCVYE